MTVGEGSSFGEVVAKLQARLLDAKKLSVGAQEPQEFTLGMFLQLLNDCEKQRQICMREMQSHRELAKAAEFQAGAFGMIHSMAYAVYDGFIRAEEKAIAERQEREAEKAAAAASDAAPVVSLVPEEAPKGRKPRTKK
jgi:hypothetical protein